MGLETHELGGVKRLSNVDLQIWMEIVNLEFLKTPPNELATSIQSQKVVYGNYIIYQ